jgi:hypothetical protein
VGIATLTLLVSIIAIKLAAMMVAVTNHLLTAGGAVGDRFMLYHTSSFYLNKLYQSDINLNRSKYKRFSPL